VPTAAPSHPVAVRRQVREGRPRVVATRKRRRAHSRSRATRKRHRVGSRSPAVSMRRRRLEVTRLGAADTGRRAVNRGDVSLRPAPQMRWRPFREERRLSTALVRRHAISLASDSAAN